MIRNKDRRPHWQPDSSRDSCNGCLRGFTLWKRRHHCRLCGLLYCSDCSGCLLKLPESVINGRKCARLVVLGYGNNKKRCCRQCKRKLQRDCQPRHRLWVSHDWLRHEKRRRVGIESGWWGKFQEIAWEYNGCKTLIPAYRQLLCNSHNVSLSSLSGILQRWGVLGPKDNSILIFSLVYIERITRVISTMELPFPTIVVVSLMIATKIRGEGSFPDQLPSLQGHPREIPLSGSVFCQILKVDVNYLNLAEAMILLAIDWSLSVSPSEYYAISSRVELYKTTSVRRIQRWWRQLLQENTYTTKFSHFGSIWSISTAASEKSKGTLLGPFNSEECLLYRQISG